MKLRTALLLSIVIAAQAVAVAGCKSEPNEGKLMPKLPPHPDLDLPKDLRIAVEIDGQPGPAIDAARLAAVAPDFADAERRAWRFESLLGPAVAKEGTTVYAIGARDLSVELRPRTADGLVGVLMVSRRGDVIALMVEEKQPFPTFHGQGGRLGRPPGEGDGEPLPRVSKVQKLRVVSAAKPPTP